MLAIALNASEYFSVPKMGPRAEQFQISLLVVVVELISFLVLVADGGEIQKIKPSTISFAFFLIVITCSSWF